MNKQKLVALQRAIQFLNVCQSDSNVGPGANYPHPPGLAQPGTPWCAVALHEGILQFPDAIEWLGDFERVVAWSVLLKPKGLH